MSQQFLSINKGQSTMNLANVLTATSTPSADFFFQILSTNSPKKEDCIFALDAFRNYILSNGVPQGQVGTNLPVL